MMRFFSCRFLFLLLTAAIFCGATAASSQETIRYVYDERGRLIQAFSQSGHSFQFAYDAAGNLITTRESDQADPGGADTSPAAVVGKRISGTLYSGGGTPFPSVVTLKLFSGASCSDLQLAASTRSEAGNGSYTFENLSDGTYYVYVDPSGTGILPQWYSTTGSAFDCGQAAPVSLLSVPEATGRNITLNQASSISGAVMEGGSAIPSTDGIYVKVYTQNACTGPLVQSAPINPADGRFTVQGLSAGTYFLLIDPGASGYQPEWWASGGNARGCANAEAITIASGGHVETGHILLDQGSSLSGTIYQSDGQTAVTGNSIAMEAYTDHACIGMPASSSMVDARTGSYAFSGLPPGTYFVRARNLEASYIDEWWSPSGNAFSCEQAGGIALAARDHVTGRDLRLDAGGSISGVVFENDGVTPVSHPVTVAFYLHQNTLTGSCGTALVTHTQTATDGTYRQPLPTGRYFMRVDPSGLDYAAVWWDSTGGTLSCQDAAYTDVNPSEGTTGRNFKLSPGSAVSGHIYESDGVTPVSSPLAVIAYADDPCDLREVARGVYNPSTGRYTISNLGSGGYTILVNGEGTAYADEWWSTSGNAYFCFQATHLQIASNQDLTDINILLDRSAKISGTIYKKDGSTPVDQGVSIAIYPENACAGYRTVKTVQSDPVTGQYAFDRLGPGNYTLLADLDSAAIYLDEWWSQGGDAFNCGEAEVISLASGTDRTGRDFRLDTKSTLSGTLYKPDGAAMNLNFTVRLYPAAACGSAQIASVTSNRTTGKFTFQNLAPGRYRLLADTNFNVYASEWWSQSGDAFTCAGSSEIIIPSGENITNLEIHMNAGAKISGMIYNENGAALVPESTSVRLYRGNPCNPEYVTSVSSSAGAYEIDALSPGDYFISTSMSYYLDRWWSSTLNAASCQEAQPVSIAQTGDAVTAIDFRLKAKGSISGKVLQRDGTTPLTSAMKVYLYKTFPPCGATAIRNTSVSADGSYTFRGLDAATYALLTYISSSAYVSEWWSAGGDAFYCNQAEAVAVADGQQVDAVHFSLHEKGRISGKVLKKSDATPIGSESLYVEYYAGASPCASSWRGRKLVNAQDGRYEITGLDAGTYFLRTVSANPAGSQFVPQWWSAAGQKYDCSGAESIDVAMDQSITEKDFALDDCARFPDKAANDYFQQATALAGHAGSLPTNNYCATAETGEPAHASFTAANSLWWRWTAPRNDTMAFHAASAPDGTVIAVYQGNAVNALTPVVAHYDQDVRNRLTFSAEKGQTYAVAVDTAGGTPGHLVLTYGSATIPPGDVNADGVVDLGDLILVLQTLTRTNAGASLSGEADVDADGKIGLEDAIFILQKMALDR